MMCSRPILPPHPFIERFDVNEQAGINLIGHISTNLGLGVAARNTAKLLAERGARFAVIDIPTASMPSGAQIEWAAHASSRSHPAPFTLNLFHMNPPEIAAELRLCPRWFRRDAVLNVVVPFWELSSLPPNWMPVLERTDLVLAPTKFVADVVSQSMKGTPVVHFPQTAYLPQGVMPDRARWGMADDETCFVFSFDLNSDPERKNPWGVVEAYRAARSELAGTATRLFIRATNAGTRMGRHHIGQLRSAVAHDATIRIIDQPLSYVEVLGLYASADAYVSLHRAEGLGLGLLESMMLGTPAIATGYSGNMDFMDDTNSLLVDYELVMVRGSDRGSYAEHKIGHGQMWAEPSVETAARHMVRLATDRVFARELAAAAQASATATRTGAERHAVVDMLMEEAGGPARPNRYVELQDASPWPWRARRVAGSVVKKLGLR